MNQTHVILSAAKDPALGATGRRTRRPVSSPAASVSHRCRRTTRLSSSKSATCGNHSLAPRPSPLAAGRTRRAFTLVELLIVLAIIGVVVALGIPLFGVLTGAKSVEAGRNIVAATVAQARTVAVNEGKYAGILFYVDPATERTAMALVIVTDPASSLEDPDPYDKYKAYVDRDFGYVAPNSTFVKPVTREQEYYSSRQDAVLNKVRVRGDRVIGVTFDANNAYRGSLYGATPLVSDYLRYFGNYRPMVRAFEAQKSHTTASTDPTNRPPLTGPFGAWAGSSAVPMQYIKPSGATRTPTVRSMAGPFANTNWGTAIESPIVRYGASEQTLLPRGIGVQVMTQPLIRNGASGLAGNVSFQERYLRTAVIMFDPQGRLTVLQNFTLRQADPANPLGDYLGLTATARNIPAGVGLAVYDTQKFTTAVLPNAEKTSQADWLYQAPSGGAGNQYLLTSGFTNLFGDYPTPASAQSEVDEEQWLDANATPLIINRYTGSLSEAE